MELSKLQLSAAQEFKAVQGSQVMSLKTETCLKTELEVKRESNSQLAGLWLENFLSAKRSHDRCLYSTEVLLETKS